ncbi:MAG: PLP-dependent aminotransferase family protein [Sedimenticola sp.]
MLAKRTENLNSSFIRDILALTQQPGIISFAGGLPDPALFPTEALQAAAMAIHRNKRSVLYQYGETAGDLYLRRWISANLTDSEFSASEIIITTGSQQALDLTARCLLNPGDKVAIEAPSYLGAIQIFTANQATLQPVPTDDEGPDMEALEMLFKQKETRYFYAIPEFQNPKGISYSLERRYALVALAKKYDIWILEDAPYTALRYRGEPLPSLQSLLPKQVIHFGSFSKIIAPGLRLGWVTAPDHIIETIIKMKQVADLHSSCYDQQLILEFLRNGALTSHLERLKLSYRRRLDMMTSSLDQHLGDGIRRSDPDGGMFVWIEMPREVAAMSLLKEAIGRGVAFVPGKAFYTDGGGDNCMRLNFTNSEPEQIAEGVRRLADLIT